MPVPITAAVVGLGVHGSATVKLLHERQVQVVAGVDLAHAGGDLGAVCDVNALEGMRVAESIADIPWQEHEIDVVVVTANVDVPTLAALSVEILERGANVLTIQEDAFDLQTYFPEEFKLIDSAAKRNKKSFVATGGGDVLWSGLIIQMSSQIRSLSAIRLFTYIGIDGYSEEFLTMCGVGNTHEQFEQTTREAANVPSPFGGVLPTIARKLGLTITEERREFKKYTEDEPHYSETFEREIAAGDPLGRRDIVEFSTAEGITLTAELLTSGINGRDELVATFEGVPSATMRYGLDPQPLSTDAATISRVIDVIEAEPGVVSTADLPTPFYRLTLQKSS